MKLVWSVALLFLVPVAFAQQSVPASPTPPPAVASEPPVVGPNYIVGPGDSLQIFVWRNPELSTTVPVRPDGKITTPLVQDLVAVGKTPSEIAKDIEKVLAEYIRSPQVNVIVSNPVSAFSQVKIVGQVVNPQSIAFREGMTVLDLILTSGGLGPYAAGNRAKIVRKQDGKTTELRVRAADLMNKGNMQHNVELRPGDVLVIPQSHF
jgi:polysaccharide biosynthesis/export protein